LPDIFHSFIKIKCLAISFPASLSPGLQPGGISRWVANPPQAVQQIPENIWPST